MFNDTDPTPRRTPILYWVIMIPMGLIILCFVALRTWEWYKGEPIAINEVAAASITKTISPKPKRLPEGCKPHHSTLDKGTAYFDDRWHVVCVQALDGQVSVKEYVSSPEGVGGWRLGVSYIVATNDLIGP